MAEQELVIEEAQREDAVSLSPIARNSSLGIRFFSTRC